MTIRKVTSMRSWFGSYFTRSLDFKNKASQIGRRCLYPQIGYFGLEVVGAGALLPLSVVLPFLWCL
jgi:hypothetical protein